MKLLLIFLLFGLCVAKKMIAFETAEVTYMNPKYGTGKLHSNKYNATTFLINASINTTKEIPSDAMLMIDIFKLSDNTYKKTALSMKKKLCPFMASPEFKMMWSPYMEERFDIPKKCPFGAGNYVVRDIDPNMLMANEIFNFLPQWDLKIEVLISTQNEPIMNLKIRFKVTDAY